MLTTLFLTALAGSSALGHHEFPAPTFAEPTSEGLYYRLVVRPQGEADLVCLYFTNSEGELDRGYSLENSYGVSLRALRRRLWWELQGGRLVDASAVVLDPLTDDESAEESRQGRSAGLAALQEALPALAALDLPAVAGQPVEHLSAEAIDTIRETAFYMSLELERRAGERVDELSRCAD